ncbi:MAG: radical SAM protein [Magnetococcales bacterium]|nr:radical SAM protein [Magnetococcales bacterium]
MSVLYSSLKFLRFGDRLQALEKGTVAAPVHIRIKPTNRCNHDCWYCCYKVSHLNLGEKMVEEDAIPEDKMHEIADDLVAMGVKAVTFTGGGEPLLYKPLPEIITRLAEGGVGVAAITNGSNLKGRVAQALASHATWVRISVDGWDDESYRKARGIQGKPFTDLLDNMTAFAKQQSDCVLGVSFIVTRENHPHLLEACTQFKEAGASHVKLSGVVVANSGGENNRYHQEIAPAVQAEIQRAQALTDDRFQLINHVHELEERFDKHYTRCPFLQFLTVIGADQNVYTCQDKAYTTSGLLGSIRERSFKDYWFSEENRQRLLTFDPSQSCPHHCVSHTKNLAILDYLAIDPDHGVFV